MALLAANRSGCLENRSPKIRAKNFFSEKSEIIAGVAFKMYCFVTT